MLRIHQVAEGSAEAGIAGGAGEGAAVGQLVDRSAGAELEDQWNAAGVLADIGNASRHEGRSELVHAGRGELEVPDMQVEQEFADVRQAGDGPFHGSGDAGMRFRKDQARDLEVVDIALDLAATDFENGGIVLEVRHEIGGGLQGELRGLHVRLDPHAIDDIRQGVESVVVQGDAPYVEF